MHRPAAGAKHPRLALSAPEGAAAGPRAAPGAKCGAKQSCLGTKQE